MLTIIVRAYCLMLSDNISPLETLAKNPGILY